MDPKNLRIEGIYQQRQEGFFMQRVKLAAGVISAVQARCVADTAERFGRGLIHLTSRGSMEIHWLKGDDLPLVKQEFAKVGLTSRGACGGAVRGVTCSSQDVVGFPQLESQARRLQRHFTGNPRYEGLPKKFKIGIEAATTGGRHLIQDVGLVFSGAVDGDATYDFWIAGGLGREPRAGFLLEEAVRADRIITVIEAIIAVYARLAPPPKRLKFLAAELGEAELRRLIAAEPAYSEELPLRTGFTDSLTQAKKATGHLVVPVFAGQLTAAGLRNLADFADLHAAGVLQVTVDQDIAFVLTAEEPPDTANLLPARGEAVTFRICPGSHECRMGLTATRDVAAPLLAAMDSTAKKLTWALSGCPNSCTQPQLADYGIVSSKMVAGEDEIRSPRFDLYIRHSAGLGEKVRAELTLEELTSLVRESLPSA